MACCWRSLAVCALCLALCHSIKLKIPVPWKLHLTMHYANQCQLPSIMGCTEMSFKRSKGGDLLLSFNCTISRDVKDFTEAELMLTRCRDAITFNTCEYYQTLRWKVGICEIIKSPAMPWPNMWSHWSPPIACPARAGNYSLTDFKVSLTDASFVNWSGYVWVGNATMRAERGALFMCKQFAFEATRVRA